jgi:phosphatidylserine/phosphatidylglycerophosphate/cardiolipin synthase-like enzyme
VAFKITGDLWKDIYFSENTVSQLAKVDLFPYENNNTKVQENSNVKINLITERKIKNEIIRVFKHTKEDNIINMAMFYLSDREIINELINASKRGVKVNIILDPNKDAFGYKKNGTPNRQVAHELIRKSQGKIKIRWYNTHGEQFHTKLIIVKINGRSMFILGSANLTRRNISNFNLETDVLVNCPENGLSQTVEDYFKLIWGNLDGNNYTVDYGHYTNKNIFSHILYRVQEVTGLCTF